MTWFGLNKWYLDCVSDDGHVVIAYRATVRVAGLDAVEYASVITCPPDGAATEVSTFPDGGWPVVSDTQAGTGRRLRWACPDLRASAALHATAAPIERELFRVHAGGVRWSCLMPRATADFRVGGTRVRGLGYAEVLDLTVPPWRLPIRELRWGRFCAPAASVVWIEWRGDGGARRCWAFLDGRPVDDVAIGDDGVQAPGLPLMLAQARTIRDGPVTGSVGPVLALVTGTLPTAVRRMRETKWLSRGRVTRADDGGTAIDGWAIHEVVRWGR